MQQEPLHFLFGGGGGGGGASRGARGARDYARGSTRTAERPAHLMTAAGRPKNAAGGEQNSTGWSRMLLDQSASACERGNRIDREEARGVDQRSSSARSRTGRAQQKSRRVAQAAKPIEGNADSVVVLMCVRAADHVFVCGATLRCTQITCTRRRREKRSAQRNARRGQNEPL